MTPTQWKTLLSAWSVQILSTDLVCHLDPADRALKYLGYLPAPKSSILSLESHLGVKLPPSYRTFLEATNGFRVISPFTYSLRPAADVDWFRVENQGWIETYNEPSIYGDPTRPETPDEQYFDYSNLNEHDFCAPHLFAMLQVSDDGDGVMLLNPLVVTPDGEWEAWFFANWIPGARRYASFAHMMVETYRSLRKLEKLHNKPKLPNIKVPRPKVLRHAVIDAPPTPKPRHTAPKRKKGQSQLEYMAAFLSEMKEEIATAPLDLVKLLKDLENPDPKARAKTVRVLRGKLRTRGESIRYPDLIPLAAQLARSHCDHEVRHLCVTLLINITPDGPVQPWLITALNDSHPWVQDAALSAIYYFKDSKLVEPVIKILSRAGDAQLAQRAATALAELGDKRAISELAAKLERTPNLPVGIPPQSVLPFLQQYYSTIAQNLAKFGPPVVSRLKTLLLHTDPNRRAAAIIGLRVLGERTSRAEVAKLKSDPDPGVRQQAEICDRIWG